MHSIPSLAVILAILLSLLILVTYLILKHNGVTASLVNGAIFANPMKLFQLAKETDNKGKKISYLGLVFLTPVLFVTFAYAAITQLSKSTSKIKCEYREYFENRAWHGKIVDKYLDQENYDFRTISVQNEDRTYKIQGQILSEFDNYELMQIGDSISKNRGEFIVHLYKSNEEIELKLGFDCK
ncbi:MAG: hypothetical protein AB3N14_13145 [Flavobacteriaceae bacterium]